MKIIESGVGMRVPHEEIGPHAGLCPVRQGWDPLIIQAGVEEPVWTGLIKSEECEWRKEDDEKWWKEDESELWIFLVYFIDHYMLLSDGQPGGCHPLIL